MNLQHTWYDFFLNPYDQNYKRAKIINIPALEADFGGIHLQIVSL